MCKNERYSRFKRAGGADIFAKRALPYSVCKSSVNRQYYDENRQYYIFNVSERITEPLFRRRNFCQKFLKQTERTEKTAYKPAEKYAEHKNKTKSVKTKTETRRAVYRLKRAYGARKRRGGARVTIKPGSA